MKKSFLTLFLADWIGRSTYSQIQATGPKIISTILAFGDMNVDTELSKIIVISNRDISLGMSVVDTPNMPQSTGMPSWIDLIVRIGLN